MGKIYTNLVHDSTKCQNSCTTHGSKKNGIWSGYVIEVNSEGKRFELETEIGVKGINIKVVVEVENGETLIRLPITVANISR